MMTSQILIIAILHKCRLKSTIKAEKRCMQTREKICILHLQVLLSNNAYKEKCLSCNHLQEIITKTLVVRRNFGESDYTLSVIGIGVRSQ